MQPSVIISTESPPRDELKAVARSLFNLFPEWEFRVSAETDSTNAEARRQTLLIGGEAYKRVFLTDFQSAGRGRQGKTWTAPPESSLLTTVMIPQANLRLPVSLLPLAASLWLMEGLERLGIKDAAVKWPNDVLAGGQKISGILCETTGAAALIGVGMNLTQQRADLPERGQTEAQATSVELEMGESFPGYLPAAITILGALMESVENPPAADKLIAQFKKHCVSLGSSVAFRSGNDTVIGIGEDIDSTGAIVVDVKGQGRRLVASPIN